MPARTLQDADPRYQALFPDWSGPRPLSWFFMENLLEARSGSGFPTNGCGPDEEVNVYLAGLLTGFLAGDADPRVQAGAGARLHPPERTLGRRARAEWYRANGDHRLLALGLADRGDQRRRRSVPFGHRPEHVRAEDLETGRLCYDAAANLLAGRAGALRDLAPVLRHLADHFEDYVHVLSALATRRLGLGTVLADTDLARLLRPAAPSGAEGDMDTLLDLVGEYRRTGDAAVRARLHALASRLGVPSSRLPGSAAPLSGSCRS